MLPWRNHHWIKNYLCVSLCVHLCSCVTTSFRAARNRCAYSPIPLLCARVFVFVICVLVMRGLNVAKSSNSRRNTTPENFVFPSLLYVRSHIHPFSMAFLLVNVSRLSLDKEHVPTYMHLPACTRPLWVISWLPWRDQPAPEFVCSCLQLHFKSVY